MCVVRFEEMALCMRRHAGSRRRSGTGRVRGKAQVPASRGTAARKRFEVQITAVQRHAGAGIRRTRRAPRSTHAREFGPRALHAASTPTTHRTAPRSAGRCPGSAARPRAHTHAPLVAIAIAAGIERDAVLRCS
ncbi:hypothetical protein HYPSUDRAFT_217195 [Hypholoma sublateritium FD-334 SS-4]|uniref:Uncharacterized protein n=1 Tax=Hypholoma sublateritium (strain FD-334 SS-4) TaxID=945553 RepID=A0A0D2NU88_HYPSF|nr:hypothetical protein HYPSUDRAFT_217195 [Hypholoma sublateritium FD-334 SS-4]